MSTPLPVPAADERIAALEARIAELERGGTRRAEPRHRRLAMRLALVVVAVALTIPAGVVMASHTFSDVSTSNKFHADIAAIAAAGVTSGCDADRYCPDGLVTRGQMAAFLNRLGALAPGKAPKVNALELNGHRMVSGTLPYVGGTRARLFQDPTTDAEVFVTANGFIEVRNSHASRRLEVAGMSSASGVLEAEHAALDPGESATFNTQTIHSRSLDLALTLQGATAAQTRFSHLFCALSDLGGGPPAYQSCIVTGRE